jgi:hypothetical protein
MGGGRIVIIIVILVMVIITINPAPLPPVCVSLCASPALRT